MARNKTENNETQPGDAETTVKVWDIWVRLFHWGLVMTVATAALTGFFANATWLQLHIIGGLMAGALVLARIVWGLLGSRHARFADFAPSPRAVIDHLRTQSRGGTHRHLGHNPLGALMVFAVLALILSLALSGLGTLGGVLRVGPLAPDLGTDTGFALREAHEILALILAALIALHLGGVAFESWRSRENLTRSMVTGRKPSRSGDVRHAPVRARGLIALTLIALAGGGLAVANATLSGRPVPGLPTATMPELVTEECGACHMAYHPALLPAANWHAIMRTLDDHFGEDASLGTDDVAEITAWLTTHAAETVDTKPARLFARGPEDALAITARPAWQRLHADLPETLFTTQPVGSASNCAACHQDAETGRMSPFAITLPKETQP
ncbi:cytochrome b/b6 domain-containing protein [Celeribacter neptunius]|uniref:Cytochrome b n=1 Tax=Celeribacter neptunius TaxID=588602 RepID=A0A1I3QZJ2_9RHOB|nr:cytochrome b/b6 domain-containing protein [Celeribacter neptunius]SFJ39624.1 Cytochrome b [Celeribacter neptunius]